MQFFEAFAEFGVAVLLAATRRDESLWDSKRNEIAEPGPRGLQPLEEATFGSWTHLGFKLAKWLRVQLQDAGAADEAADPAATTGEQARIALFAIADARFADALCDKRVWGVLEQANAFRRDLAHNRAVSARARRALLESLEELLADLREKTERTFASAALVEPGRRRNQIERILQGQTITREQINDQYTGRASSGIMLILSQIPLFEATSVERKGAIRMRIGL